MRNGTLAALLTLALMASGAVSVAAQGLGPSRHVFAAHLSGGEEVPAVDTNAQGVAILESNEELGLVDFRLIVSNIENVFAAHIHCGVAGVNGPVGVTLFFTPPPNLGPVNGILAQGAFIAPDVGNGCGWTDLEAFLTDLKADATYVNVHTLPGVPSGEIRGQLIDRRP